MPLSRLHALPDTHGSAFQLLERSLSSCLRKGFGHRREATFARNNPALGSQTLTTRGNASSSSSSRLQPRACSFFATCHPGLEEAVARELREAVPGISAVQPGRAGVSFRGEDISVGYSANLWLRSAIRVLMLLAEGPIDPSRPGGDELYHFFRGAVDWCSRLPEGQTFKVEARAWACSNVPTSLLMQ
ncbi:hypothetical protein WJX84_002687, partial [Apatococcus fuscideae]